MTKAKRKKSESLNHFNCICLCILCVYICTDKSASRGFPHAESPPLTVMILRPSSTSVLSCHKHWHMVACFTRPGFRKITIYVVVISICCTQLHLRPTITSHVCLSCFIADLGICLDTNPPTLRVTILTMVRRRKRKKRRKRRKRAKESLRKVRFYACTQNLMVITVEHHRSSPSRLIKLSALPPAHLSVHVPSISRVSIIVITIIRKPGSLS